jgi:hypothetical protein
MQDTMKQHFCGIDTIGCQLPILYLIDIDFRGVNDSISRGRQTTDSYIMTRIGGLDIILVWGIQHRASLLRLPKHLAPQTRARPSSGRLMKFGSALLQKSKCSGVGAW